MKSFYFQNRSVCVHLQFDCRLYRNTVITSSLTHRDREHKLLELGQVSLYYTFVTHQFLCERLPAFCV